MRQLYASVILFLAGVILSHPSYTLHICEGLEEREVAAIPVAPGDQFSVEYTHSIYGVRQIEVFSIRLNKTFSLERVIFGSLAAALYYNPDPSQGLTYEDNVWVLKGNGRNYSLLKYRVSPESAHRMVVKNQVIHLSRENGDRGLLIKVWVEEERSLSGKVQKLQSCL